MMEQDQPYFPLTAFVGYTVARKALLALLVDPTLRGVILSGPVGTGKSALLRSFGAFVRRHVDPDAPVVDVPIGVGDERLLGGLDIDVALATGERRARRGLLAEANGGFVVLDDLPLFDVTALGPIAAAIETGRVLCEREGLSLCHEARFTFLASAVPSEREIPFWLADKVAFLIPEQQRLGPDLVRMLVSRVSRFEASPDAVAAEYDRYERGLAEQVIAARSFYGLVTVGAVVLERLAETAMALDVAGNRADVFAAKAARAHAALRGSRVVEELDITFAIATVLAPRSHSMAAEFDHGDRDEQAPTTPEVEQAAMRSERNEGEGKNEVEMESARDDDGREDDADTADRDSTAQDAERIEDPLDFNGELPPMEQFLASQRRATVAGHRGQREQWQRGRHVRSLDRTPSGKRIALGAPLRAAAVHQQARRRDGERRVVVRREDIRVKKFSERAGTLFIFCVDASGSMANNRMREAKGAVTQLLEEAYVNRDEVALVAFRGAEAELLLPPTGSVERAKRTLDILPTGGGTPLAGALVKAYGIAEAARRRGSDRVLVVVLTDGRANVPIVESSAGMIMEIRRRHVRQELEQVAVAFRRDGVATLVIDTRRIFVAQSETVRLAEMLGARYFFLPQFDASGLTAVIREHDRGRL